VGARNLLVRHASLWYCAPYFKAVGIEKWLARNFFESESFPLSKTDSSLELNAAVSVESEDVRS